MAINLRELVESDLETTLEGEWSAPVRLTDPQGVRYTVRGQILNDIVRNDPENGDRMVINQPVISLRRSTLTRIPVYGENWLVEISEPNGVLTQFAISPTRPPEGGSSIGFIRLYLQAVEQS